MVSCRGKALLVFWLLAVSICLADEQQQKIRVGVSQFAPFVMGDQPDKLGGYSIELWRSIADHLDLDYEFVICDGVKGKLEAVEQQKVDVAIGGITITSAREERVDFTHSCYRTGLDILINPDGQGSSLKRLSLLFTKSKLSIVISFLLLIVISGHLMWIAERGKDAFSDNYFPGVFEGMYWAIVTASTVGYGDKAPMKWAGRVLAMVVIIAALPMFALFTAEVASSFALQEIRGYIEGPDDLHRHRVGVVEGTTSAEYVANMGIKVRYYKNIETAYEDLQDRYIEAVVYDAPNLNYYARHKGRDKTRLVGNVFHPQEMGFAVTPTTRYGNASTGLF